MPNLKAIQIHHEVKSLQALAHVSCISVIPLSPLWLWQFLYPVQNDWNNYIADETYAARLSFDEVVDNAVVVGKYLENVPEKN